MIVPTKKLILIVPRDWERRIVRRLGELGVVHLRRVGVGEARELLEAELDAARELEEVSMRLVEVWYSLYRSGFEEERADFRRYLEVKRELDKLYAEKAELQRLREIINGIRSMGEDEMPFLGAGAELFSLMIILPKESLGKLIGRIRKLGVLVKHAELSSGEILLHAVGLRDKMGNVQDLINDVYHQEVVLPDQLPRRCDEALSQLNLRLSDLERRIAELESELRGLRERLIWLVDEGEQGSGVLGKLRSEVLELCEELSIKGGVGGVGEEISPEEAERVLSEITARYNSIRGKLDEVRRERERLKRLEEVLRFLGGVDAELPKPGDYEDLSLFIGMMDEEGLRRVGEALAGRPAAFEVLALRDGTALLAVTCLRDRSGEVREVLNDAGFEDLTDVLAGLSASPREELERVSGRIESLEAEERRLLEELSELRRRAAPRLVEIYNALELSLRLEEALRGSLRTEYLRIVQGWVPEDLVSWISERLEKLREGSGIVLAYRFEDPKPGERAPTLLKNPGAFKVFESLVALYGWPSRREIDPTVISGILWTVMFGLMFPDLGQGIAIIGMGLFFAYVFKRSILGMNSRKLGRLMIGMGISASFFGLLFGEFFLMEVQPLLPGLRPGWLEEASGIIWLIKVAVFFGAAQILVALILSTIKELRNGELAGAVFSHHGVAGIMAYTGFILTAFHFLGVSVIPGLLEFPNLGIGALSSWPFLLMLGGLAMMILKPILEREPLSLGLGSLLEVVTAFLANTLSYARVAGFAIVHAALAMVVYEMMHANPFMGVGLGLILLNLVSLTIELLVVAIQAMRLLFYEFYSKFYEGAGTPYRPWKIR